MGAPGKVAALDELWALTWLCKLGMVVQTWYDKCDKLNFEFEREIMSSDNH